VKIWKQSLFVDAEEIEPEPTEKAMSVFNLTEWLLVTEAGSSLSADTDGNEQRATAPGQKIVWTLASFLETMLNGQETYLVGDYFTKSSVTHAKFLSLSQPSSS